MKQDFLRLTLDMTVVPDCCGVRRSWLCDAYLPVCLPASLPGLFCATPDPLCDNCFSYLFCDDKSEQQVCR
ncbi:hypothetical protein E2C01_018680 [Portunus trituberculatus]|uniref:Uncharacterized protein n=1 Tax=Portunus trituberculatus TaxID=210409 RepID=A0A5B7DX73_PORTR|nr:hypothetical protein [Portunus trituberculatus]